MIVEGLSSIVFWFFDMIFSGFQLLSLPLDLINVVITFMSTGAWVLGVDLFVLVISSIIFWLTFKFSAGLVLFIWRLLPLT